MRGPDQSVPAELRRCGLRAPDSLACAACAVSGPVATATGAAFAASAPGIHGSNSATTTPDSLQRSDASSDRSALGILRNAASCKASTAKKYEPRSTKWLGHAISSRTDSRNKGNVAAAAAWEPGHDRRSTR